MTWAGKTFWVNREDGTPDYAITSDLEAAELREVLSLPEETSRITPAVSATSCGTCPHIETCMGSVWTDGKRMSGPLLGSAPLSEVLTCHYCTGPMLTLYKRGSENPVPEACPRRTDRAGDCDGCRRFRSSIAERPDVSEEDGELARTLLGQFLTDTGLQAALSDLPEEVKGGHFRRWISVLSAVLTREDVDPVAVVRAFVLEMTDGPMEKAWMEKTSATRRFAIRCWEGLARRALAR